MLERLYVVHYVAGARIRGGAIGRARILTLELSADGSAAFDPAAGVALAQVTVRRRVEEEDSQEKRNHIFVYRQKPVENLDLPKSRWNRLTSWELSNQRFD
jgi:hypothetical protein